MQVRCPAMGGAHGNFQDTQRGLQRKAQKGEYHDEKTRPYVHTRLRHRLCTRPCSAYRHQPWLLVEHRMLVFRPYMHCISDYKIL